MASAAENDLLRREAPSMEIERQRASLLTTEIKRLSSNGGLVPRESVLKMLENERDKRYSF
ncbi:unnamed protein product [Arabis nemorensis]|uniref:Uncharacterized protein n=1 Tax=Arabis nemorensis TaxID=586526 RepID=A0A565AZU7_9BRAS|nr:unnamed protein product [Arabis nemorensis]